MRARARVLLLKGQAVTEDQLAEITQLEQFIAAVDAMVEVFPEAQRKIIRLSILDDLPVTKVAIDVGYHYTWVLELRDRAVKTIEQVLNGDIILSELGLNLKGAIHDSIT